LRGANGTPVTVQFYGEWYAKSGSDYQPSSGKLEFRPGAGGKPKLNLVKNGDRLQMRWTSTADSWELFETESFGSAFGKKRTAHHRARC
jgi:hypothetical protein